MRTRTARALANPRSFENNKLGRCLKTRPHSTYNFIQFRADLTRAPKASRLFHFFSSFFFFFFLLFLLLSQSRLFSARYKFLLQAKVSRPRCQLCALCLIKSSISPSNQHLGRAFAARPRPTNQLFGEARFEAMIYLPSKRAEGFKLN